MSHSALERLWTELKRISDKRLTTDKGHLWDKNKVIKLSKKGHEIKNIDSETESKSERQADIPATKKHIYSQVCSEYYYT